jgi:hypothetical protein
MASDDAVALLRRLMRAAAEKSGSVSEQLHPAWVQAAWQRIGFPGNPMASTTGLERCAPALAAVYGLRFESLARFAHRAHRIALLPRKDMLKVLTVVALHAKRESVRLCISRNLRAAIVASIGAETYAALLDAPPRPNDSTAAVLDAEALQPERLALEGYTVLSENRAWRCKSTLAWVQLALPPVAIPASSDFSNGAADPDSVLDRLPQFFPEHSWLFGSPMDQALSV